MSQYLNSPSAKTEQDDESLFVILADGTRLRCVPDDPNVLVVKRGDLPSGFDPDDGLPPLDPPFPKKPSGEYSDDERRVIVSMICERAAEGGVGNTFKRAAKEIGISRGILWRWVLADKDLKAMYESARIQQAHSTGEDAIIIADTATGENAAAVRIQVDTRKWYTSKIAPKIYGDKLELAGPGGIPLIPPAPTRFDASRLSLEELERMDELLAKGTVLNALPPGEADATAAASVAAATILAVPAIAARASEGTDDGR